MTLSTTDTSVSHVLTENEARELTAEIYGHLDTAWDKIIQAYLGRAWAALGYESWDAYCKGEFHGAQLKLPRAERQEVVTSLRDAGLSTRAIASATGSARNTVATDLEQVAQIEPPETSSVVGMDGKTYTPPEPHVVDAEIVRDEPAKPRRRPLPDQAQTAAYELRKAVDKAHRVVTDDAYRRNRDQVHVAMHGDVEYARTLIQEILDTLDQQ